MTNPTITLSVVSHRQNGLVNQLLKDVERHCAGMIALVLTQNVPDLISLATSSLSSRCEIIVNERPKGFGANHNAAFTRCRTPFFCVANPDIRLPANPFPALIQALADERVGVVGPLVRDPDGMVEDNARRFLTTGVLRRKLFGGRPKPDYHVDKDAVDVEWIAGVFMLVRSDTYRAVGGFNAAHFLYYEDVDL